MIALLYLFQGIIERGLIFSFVVASVFISSRLIKFDNLAIEGSFGLGGALGATLLLHDYSPWVSILSAFFAGALSGIVTGILYTKLKINNLISGIVVTTGLFSVILKIAGSNISLSNKKTIFSTNFYFLKPYITFIFLIIFSTIIFSIISWLLKTEIGYLLKIVGHSPQMLTNVGKSIHFYTLLGLIISNSLAALSGVLFVHYTGYFSIWTYVGILIMGLAGMMLAGMINKHFGSALIIGSIIYQAIIALTFELEINQDWNKLVTALIIVILMSLKNCFYKK